MYGPREPPSVRRSEERSHASRTGEERSRSKRKSEDRTSKSKRDHRSSPSKGFREKEHYSRKEERFVHMQEDDLKESKDNSHPEEVDAEKKKKGTSAN